MSTSAPESAAQLFFELVIEMLMVSNTPVLSALISLRNREEGVCVGKGPSVSVGATVQVPELAELPELPEVVVMLSVLATLSFLQASSITGTELAPIKKWRRNLLRDCSIVVCF